MPSDYANELMGRVGLDTTEWKKGITDLNAGIKKIETSFQATAALMDDWSGSSEGLGKRIDSLNDKLELQKKKLEILKKAYEEEVAQNGASSKAAVELAKKMYQTQGEIERTRQNIEKYGKSLDDVTNKTKAQIKKAEELGDKLEKAGSKISKAGSALTIGVTTPVIAAGAAIYKYSSDLTEAENKTEAVFGNMTQYVKDWAQGSIDKIGMAKSTAYDAVSLFGDMATSMGLSRKEAADMSMSLVELSADLSSFKNISIEESQNALKSIFTGETETLKNLGIIMTETELKAYAMSEGFEKSYSEMSQAEKVQLRYQYVLDRSANAIGDYARTNGEAAGQMRLLPEALKELAASFKENVEPAITPVVTALNNAIVSFGKLDDGTKNVIVTTSLAIAALGPLVTVIGKGVTAAGKLQKAYAFLLTKLKLKTKATVEDTAANTANAASLDKTAASANKAGNSVGGIGSAAKSATPYIIAVAAALAGITAYINKIKSGISESVAAEYNTKIKKSNEVHQNEIDNLTDEYNTCEETQNKKIAAEEKYWDERISGLEDSLSAQKKAIDTEMKLYEEAHEARMEQLEKERDLKLDNISAEESRLTSELQAQIDALDALTEAEEAEKQERENAEKLEELKKEISQAKTYAEKVEAEKAYTEEVRRQEEEKTKAAREEQKKQLQAQIEQIQAESENKRNQVNEEYNIAAQLEQDKYDMAQQGFEQRLSALDTYIEDETARLTAARDASIAIMQEETDAYLSELQKRIDEENKLKETILERLEAEKQAEIERQTSWDTMLNADKFEAARKVDGKGYSFWDSVWATLIGANASGTNNWRGGLTWINEEGGELVNLPRGTQIIPHDVSMEAAREYGRQRAAITTNNTTTTNNSYNYGAQQQVNVFKVGDKTVAQVITPAVSVNLSNRLNGRRRSGAK